MKTVYTNSSDLIHLFAQQDQNNARCSNVFFEGTKIYSYGYHYLLGEFLDNNAILINDSGYSSTTSKHIYKLKYATSQYKQFFFTPTDLKSDLYHIKSDLKSLINARKPEKYISNSTCLFDKLNEFIEFTKNKALKNTIEYKEIKALINAINSDAKNKTK